MNKILYTANHSLDEGFVAIAHIKGNQVKCIYKIEKIAVRQAYSHIDKADKLIENIDLYGLMVHMDLLCRHHE